MTADTDKGSANCLLCNVKVTNSAKSAVKIFSQSSTASEKPLAQIIGRILDETIEDRGAKSVVCKKCCKVVNEVDELEIRLATVKDEIITNYRKSKIKKVEEESGEEEYNDHDYTDTFESHAEDSTAEEVDPEVLKQDKKICIVKLENNEATGSVDDGERNLETELAAEAETETVEVTEAEAETEVEGETLIDMDIESQFEEVHDTASEDGNNDTETTENVEKDSMQVESDGKKESSGKSKKVAIKAESTVDVNIEIVSKQDDEYTCLLCMTEEGFKGDAKAMIGHMKETHDTRLYICDVCGADFRKRNDLSYHLDEHVAKEEGDFQCEVCNRIFNNLRLFRIHKRVHFPQVKSWSCDTCGKKYSSKNLLDEHINTHTGLRPYMCEVCGKDFASKYTFKAHSKIHEVRPRPFSCSQCDKSFMSQQNLNQHERTHNGVKEYVCHQCGKAFGSPHNLEVHNIVHTGYKPFICRTCGKAFARRAEIRDHERTHTGEKPYQCEHCGTTFSQRSNLQSHKRATHYNDKRYKCDDCGKGFKRRRLLDYHLKAVHTGERPYKCTSCPSTFVYPEHFKKHMRIHTGEKPYLCEVCGKAFNSRDNRNAHRFIHSDKKPYECLVCGMGFMRKPLLYTHMQTQNHLNDTIVVNQPRLSTEEDQLITIPSGNVELQLAETEVYVTDLKDHVIIQQGDEQLFEGNVLNITTDGTVPKSEVRQLVVDGSTLSLEGGVMECKTEDTEIAEEVYLQEGDDGETIVINSTNADLSQIEDGKNGVRLVKIRLPPNVGDGRSWLSLVQ